MKDCVLVCETTLLVVPILLSCCPSSLAALCFVMMGLGLGCPHFCLSPWLLISSPSGGRLQGWRGRTCPFLFASCERPIYTCTIRANSVGTIRFQSSLSLHLTPVCWLDCQSVITGPQGLAAPGCFKYPLWTLHCVMHFAHVVLLSSHINPAVWVFSSHYR